MTAVSIAEEPALQSSVVHGIPLEEGPPFGALTLGNFLKEVTERYAEREALVFHGPDGVVRWSYAELWEQANAVARSLLALGAVKGARIGVMMTNRPEFASAIFGVGLTGGVVVPLSTFSTAEELDYLLDKSGVSILLFERSVARKDFASMLLDLEPLLGSQPFAWTESNRFPHLRHVAVVGDPATGSAIEDWEDFLARGGATPQSLVDACRESVFPSDLGGIFFSSGSTNRPKGILSTHRSMVLQSTRQAWLYCMKDDVRSWAANGFFWSGNFAGAFGATLWVGGSMVLQRIFDPDEALRLFGLEKVTMPHAWPHQWAQLAASPIFAEADLSSMRYVDPTTPLAQHPTVSCDWHAPFWCYGSSETFTISTGYPGDFPPEIGGGTHGPPLPGNILKIVDPVTGETLPRNERGEIAIKGPTLMMGYLGIPLDETLDDGGFFRSGDGGYVDDGGRLVWEGRLTDIIKTGGANVSPLEVDEALMRHPDVKAAKTVGLPHETLGEIVVACIVRHEGASVSEDDLSRFLKEKLASYKLPRQILFLEESELALTGTSKIKSDKVKEIALEKLGA